VFIRYSPVDELARKIVARLPGWLFDSSLTTFADPDMASASYLLAVKERLELHGHDKYNIQDRLFGFCTSRIKQNNIKKRFGWAPIFIEERFLDTMKQFDAVIGNPPYQNIHEAKRWPLWHMFVNKAHELSDVVAFVVPGSLVGPGDTFRSIKSQIKYLNLDAKKYFNVGSTFCWFITDKSFSGNATVTSNDYSYELDLEKTDFLPLNVNEKTLEMLNKLTGNRVWSRGEFHTSKKSWMAEDGINVYHTGAQIHKTKTHHPNMNKIRVGVYLSGYPKFIVVENEGLSQACFWTEFHTKEQATEFAEFCNSEKVQSILSEFKWSGWNSKEVIQRLDYFD
jgi:hypothetical protein